MTDTNAAPRADADGGDAVVAPTGETLAAPAPRSPEVEGAAAAESPQAPVEGAEAATSTDSGSQPRVVYVEAPLPPKKKGNRAIGALFAVMSALLYAALMAVAFAITGRTESLASGVFLVPVLAFTVGFVLLVLVVNRANWWAHVVGSIFVAAFVYFGTIGVILLLNNVLLFTPAQAEAAFAAGLVNPQVVLAALLAREVSLWAGAAISANGRRVKAKNIAAREQFDREAARRRAEFDATSTVA